MDASPVRIVPQSLLQNADDSFAYQVIEEMKQCSSQHAHP